jgi:dimethylargininase
VVRLIMRPPSEALRRALSQHPERDRIDPERAVGEHAAYLQAIQAAGVFVTVLPAEPKEPDACFTWDTLLAFARPMGGATVLLVATRPGEASRRPEVASVLECARGIAPTAEVARILEPGTLDGGDVIAYGPRVAIGISARTSEAGASTTRGAGAADWIPGIPLPGRRSVAPGVGSDTDWDEAVDWNGVRL